MRDVSFDTITSIPKAKLKARCTQTSKFVDSFFSLFLFIQPPNLQTSDRFPVLLKRQALAEIVFYDWFSGWMPVRLFTLNPRRADKRAEEENCGWNMDMQQAPKYSNKGTSCKVEKEYERVEGKILEKTRPWMSIWRLSTNMQAKCKDLSTRTVPHPGLQDSIQKEFGVLNLD